MIKLGMRAAPSKDELPDNEDMEAATGMSTSSAGTSCRSSSPVSFNLAAEAFQAVRERKHDTRKTSA